MYSNAQVREEKDMSCSYCLLAVVNEGCIYKGGFGGISVDISLCYIGPRLTTSYYQDNSLICMWLLLNAHANFRSDNLLISR